MNKGTGEQGNKGGRAEEEGVVGGRRHGKEGKKVSAMRELDGELDGSVHIQWNSYHRTSFIDASWDTWDAPHLFPQLFSIQATAHCTLHTVLYVRMSRAGR